MNTLRKPEIAPAAHQIVADVYAGSSLSMASFVALLASGMPEAQAEQLAMGKIEFDQAAHTFIGHEPVEDIREGALDIKIPAIVGGSYVSTPTSCNLTFLKDETVEGQEHFLFVRVDAHLQSVEITQTQINLVFDKSQANTTIDFTPQGE